jgi:hypothetical protein
VIRDGHIWLTDAPGWGADIDERVLREHPWPRPGERRAQLFYGMDPGRWRRVRGSPGFLMSQRDGRTCPRAGQRTTLKPRPRTKRAGLR